MNITDELLMAYADGEVDEMTRSEIAAAIENDPALAARVREHELMRARVQEAFAPVLDERIPERLVAAVHSSPNPTADVADLQQVRQFKEQRARKQWSWLEWGSLAASLLLGVIVGRTALDSDRAVLVERGGELVAAGALADALERKLSNEEGEHRIGLSFRSNDGEYCRAFIGRGGAELAGLACRTADAWYIRVLSEGRRRSTEYELAGSQLPEAVLATIDNEISGEPLTIEQEKAARGEQWQ